VPTRIFWANLTPFSLKMLAGFAKLDTPLAPGAMASVVVSFSAESVATRPRDSDPQEHYCCWGPRNIHYGDSL
jgi:hypothetical protein